jgi:hypothetical protein
MSRTALIALRRELVEKITKTLPNSKLFRDGIMYPRRYFDDLIFEQRMKQQTVVNEFGSSEKGLASAGRLAELVQNKLPFGIVSGKFNHTPLGGSKKTFTFGKDNLLSPRKNSSSVLSEDDTEASKIDVRGNNYFKKNSVSFIPGELILDVDSAADIRSIRIKQDMDKSQMQRNNRNYTIEAKESRSSL